MAATTGDTALLRLLPSGDAETLEATAPLGSERIPSRILVLGAGLERPLSCATMAAKASSNSSAKASLLERFIGAVRASLRGLDWGAAIPCLALLGLLAVGCYVLQFPQAQAWQVFGTAGITSGAAALFDRAPRSGVTWTTATSTLRSS